MREKNQPFKYAKTQFYFYSHKTIFKCCISEFESHRHTHKNCFKNAGEFRIFPFQQNICTQI